MRTLPPLSRFRRRATEPPAADVPAAEVAVDEVAVDEVAVDDRACANCGTPAPLAYCPACGQAQHSLHRSLRAWAEELLDTFAGWDGKIPATLWLLFRHPGRLTADYLAGRRARYLPPLRLYLSLVLVLVLARQLTGKSDGMLQVNFTKTPPPRVTARPVPPRADSAAAATAGREGRSGLDSSLTASGPWQKMKRTYFGTRLTSLERMSKAERERAVRSAFLAKVGNMFFALVPVFALLLAGLYRRGPLVYAEHLVFALHVHAFAAGALALAAALPRGGWRVLPVLWVPAHLAVALRTVYGGSRAATLGKFVVLALGYLVALVVALAVTGLLAFLVG